VLVPDWKPGVAFWRKVGTRKANALTKVSMAAFAQLSSRRITRVRIALGAVAPTVVRLRKVEQLLEGASRSEIGGDSLVVEARTLCEAAVRPIDDQRSTAEYRREVAANLLSSFIEILRERFATSAATRKSI
jgi:xanthine dehydrogenase FAD-binding subunit